MTMQPRESYVITGREKYVGWHIARTGEDHTLCGKRVQRSWVQIAELAKPTCAKCLSKHFEEVFR